MNSTSLEPLSPLRLETRHESRPGSENEDRELWPSSADGLASTDAIVFNIRKMLEIADANLSGLSSKNYAVASARDSELDNARIDQKP